MVRRRGPVAAGGGGMAEGSGYVALSPAWRVRGVIVCMRWWVVLLGCWSDKILVLVVVVVVSGSPWYAMGGRCTTVQQAAACQAARLRD